MTTTAIAPLKQDPGFLEMLRRLDCIMSTPGPEFNQHHIGITSKNGGIGICLGNINPGEIMSVDDFFLPPRFSAFGQIAPKHFKVWGLGDEARYCGVFSTSSRRMILPMRFNEIAPSFDKKMCVGIGGSHPKLQKYISVVSLETEEVILPGTNFEVF